MGERFVIWSNEHRAWWRPCSMGYSTHLAEAGRYELSAAVRICTEANVAWRAGENPNELPILESVAKEMHAQGVWPWVVA